MQFVYIIYQVKGCQNILKPGWRQLAFSLYKAFLKNKKRSRTSLTYLILLYFTNWPNFIVWLPLIRGMLGNMGIVIFANQVVTS